MADTVNSIEQNPLLAGKIRLPGRVFQLPSRGALYSTELDPAVHDGEVHVHPMTALAEINLKNPDQLFNGKAISEVLHECVPSVKQPIDLFGRDVDALLFFLRIATYGSEYRIEVKHTCDEAKNHGYTVDLEKIVNEMKHLDPTLLEANRVVDIGGMKVYTRPMRFSDIVKLFHFTNGKKQLTETEVKELLIQNLMCMIEKVDDVINPKHIEQWARTLITPEVNKITSAAEKLNDWGPNQVVNLKCKDCGHDMAVELPMNPTDFFTV